MSINSFTAFQYVVSLINFKKESMEVVLSDRLQVHLYVYVYVCVCVLRVIMTLCFIAGEIIQN